MSEQIDSAGQRVFEMFGAVAAAPDDVAAGEEADASLAALEELLVAAGGPTADR
ncbi:MULTISPECIES: hypothetical protein [Streptomycetaceae]|uniref:hypothetical protein n=1 Tax=unclassified Streptomyces TaxID=2593676 RepID=UPI00336F854E